MEQKTYTMMDNKRRLHMFTNTQVTISKYNREIPKESHLIHNSVQLSLCYPVN